MNEKEQQTQNPAPEKEAKQAAPSILDAPVEVARKQSKNPKHKRLFALVAGVLALVLLGVGIGLLAAGNDDADDPSDDTSEPSGIVLYEKEKDDVTSIVITPAKEEPFTLVRVAKEDWRLADLKEYDPHESYATGLANALSGLTAQKLVTQTPENLADYGLDDAQVWLLAVTFADGSGYTLRLGSANPAGAGSYFQIAGKDAVYLSDDIIHNNGHRPKTDYLTTELVAEWQNSEKAAVFNKLVLSGSNRPQAIVLEPTPQNELEDLLANDLKMTSPYFGHLNADVYTELAENMFGIYAEKVVCIKPTAQQLAEYGLDHPVSSLALKYEGDSYYALYLGKKDQDGLYYCRRSDRDLVYALSPDVIVWEDLTAQGLYTPLLYAEDIADLKGITLKTQEKTYHFLIQQPKTEEDDITVLYEGTGLDVDNFKDFYQVLISSSIVGTYSGETKDKESDLTITFEKSAGKGEDLTVQFLNVSAREVAVVMNGRCDFTLTRSLVDKIIADLPRVIKDQPISTDF